MPIISKVFLQLTAAHIIWQSVEPHLHLVNGEALPQLDVIPPPTPARIRGPEEHLELKRNLCS